MKKTIRLFLLLPLFGCFWGNGIHAQSAVISGPDQLCFGECGTYTVFSTFGTVTVEGWVVNGVPVPQSTNLSSILACANQSSGLNILAFGVLTFPNGIATFEEELSVEVLGGAQPRIISTSAQCPDSLSVCDRVCAFHSATYEATNLSPGSTVSWQVFGAQNFTPNGNSLSVDWGGPGQGQVTAIVDSPPASEPLQVFCGMLGFNSNNPNALGGDAYLDIWGGLPPYQVLLSSPFVTTGTTVPSSTNFQNLLPGTYFVKVTDASGNVVECSFVIASSDADCWATVHPVEISHPSSCNACDGFLFVAPGAQGTIFNQYQWSNGATGAGLQGLCPGTYSVTMTDGVGCSHTISIDLVCEDVVCPGESSLCVEILEEPMAQIGSIPPAANGVVEICQGQAVFFKNQSLGASAYSWDFGDLKTSALFEPDHTYPVPGTYTVALIARNECFCSDTTFLEILVLPAEVPQINCVGTVCEGETVTYSTDANCGTFTWNVSGGGTILDGGGPADNFVTVEWNSGPEGTISLAVSGCAGNICTTPNVVPIPIIAESAQIQGRTNVCEGSTEDYHIPNYQGTEITWSVIGSGNITAGQGTERVTINWFGNANLGNPQKVIVTFNNCYLGCEGRDTLDVNIVPSFYAKGPIQVCEKTMATYTSHNSITNAPVLCNWVVQDGGGNTLWSALSTATANVDWSLPPGNYTVRARPTLPGGYCNDQYDVFVKTIAAPPLPTGIAGEDEICPGETYSYLANGIPVNDFNWTVTGGTPATFQGNPVNITWGPAPPYNISLTQTAITGLGCTSDPIAMNVGTLPPFSITGEAAVCAEETGIYEVPFFQNTNYAWSVAPAERGTIISGQGTPNVEVLWHSAGPANLSAQVCGVVENIAVTVLPLPLPQVAHPASLCAGSTALVSTTVAFSSYTWLNESGAVVSNAPAPDLGPGYYTVEVVDGNGCMGSASFNMESLPLPAVTVSVPLYAGLCPGGPSVTITASTTADGYDFQWFENGAPVGTNSPFLTVNTVGTFSVVVTDQNGCTNGSNTLTLVDCSSAGGTCIGGVCGFPGAGLPSSGCVPGGSISFDIQKTADCLTRNFINTSVNDVPGTWFWRFGDPASAPNHVSMLENPSHTFSGVGFYTIIFTGQIPNLNGGTCLDGQFKQDTILATADFDFKTACPGVPVVFTDISEIMPYATITAWDWDFGDPASGALNTSTAQHPVHIFQAPGVYAVSLTVTEMSGCQATMTKNVTIFDPPNVSFALPVFSCENTSLPFAAVVPANVTDLQWSFGDPASGAANSATQPNTYHDYDTPGLYTISLTATNIYGCTASFSDALTVTPNTLGGTIAYSQPSPICEGDNITLTAPAGGTAYQWAGSQTGTQITVATSGIYEVTLTDADGCTYSPPPAPVSVFGEPNGIIQAVEYNEFGQPVAFFENNYTVCEGEDVHLIILGNLGYSYQWSSGGGGTEAAFTEDRGNLLPLGNHDFTVTVTDNATGCTSAEGPFTVTVNPKPDVQITASPASFLCENNPATLSVISPNANWSYNWNTGEMGTSIVVVAGGTYFVQATNQVGCKSRSNEVVIHNAPDIDNIPAGCHTRCSPDTLCLPPMPNVASFQWYFNGSPMTPPNGTLAEPIFTQSGEYHVLMTDIFGCKAFSDVLTLDLVPGFGDVLGNVYFDVNQNGIIDGPDTLVSGIHIFLNNGSVNIDTVTSNNTGAYIFPDILSTNYTLVLDTLNLPPGWSAVFAEGAVQLAGCDVEEAFDWLLTLLCAPDSVSQSFQACPGTGIVFDGTFVPAGTTETFLYQSVASGCDSIVTVTVDPFVTVLMQEQLGACTGTTITYNGMTLNPGDMEEFVFTDVNGCDSVVQVSVEEWPVYNIPLALEVCQNTFVTYNGMTLNPGDQEDFLFVSENGCDSVMAVSVTGFAADTSQLALNACPGSTVVYQGVALAPGDQQDFDFTDVNGCDSVVQVSVGAWPAYTLPVALSACENGSVVFNGQTFFPNDQTDIMLTTINGCDSILQVTVAAIPVDTTALALQVCEGETMDYNGLQLVAGDQLFVMLTSALTGCDSVVDVGVSAYPAVAFDVVGSETCWNGADGQIEVQNVQGSSAPYLVSLDGSNYQPGFVFENIQPGGYTVHLLDANDCHFEQPAEVPMIPQMVVQTVDQTMQCGDLVELAPVVTSPLPVEWQWPGGFSGPVYPVSSPGVFPFTVSNACETVNQTIAVSLEATGLEAMIYMPNSFSPNNDGQNDCYRGYVAPTVQVEAYSLKIFDRWGALLFETNDINGCWDGMHRDKQMQPGVLVWYMELLVRNCDGNLLEIFEEGGIHLVR